MKKTLIQVSTALFCLSTSFSFSGVEVSCEKLPEITFSEFLHTHIPLKEFRFSHLFGLNNMTNLKTYHYGLKFLKPTHKIPNRRDLLNKIHSHHHFIGLFSKQLDVKENQKFLKKQKKSFFIYEIINHGKSDFYLVYAHGARHFSINHSIKNQIEIAWLDNHAIEFYPSNENFIRCTLS